MVADSIKGSTVGITGGTGSFGSTMVEHLLTREVAHINILSRDEAKQDDMRRRFDDPRLRFFLGDVRDYDSVAAAFVNTDFVFHAAALKQVPSCEFFPLPAVKTNVVGSQHVVERWGTGMRSVVFLSRVFVNSRRSRESHGHSPKSGSTFRTLEADTERADAVRAEFPAFAVRPRCAFSRQKWRVSDSRCSRRWPQEPRW